MSPQSVSWNHLHRRFCKGRGTDHSSASRDFPIADFCFAAAPRYPFYPAIALPRLYCPATCSPHPCYLEILSVLVHVRLLFLVLMHVYEFILILLMILPSQPF